MRSNSKPPSQRQLRVGEQIRHLLAECFQRGNVPDEFWACPPVSILEARVSPDFSYCKVFISILSAEDFPTADLIKRLNKSAGFFRTVLAKKLRLRIAPELRFFPDDIQHEADHIDALLASEKVRRDVEAPRDEDNTEKTE